MKEELYEALKGHGVKYIDISEAVEHVPEGDADGVRLRVVRVFAGEGAAHTWTVDPDEPVDRLAENIKQYLRNRT